MCIIMGLGKILDKKVNVKFHYMQTILILLVFFPEIGNNYSFMFSAISLFGILWIAPVLEKKLRQIVNNSLNKLISVSISAQLLVSPMVIQIFGCINPIGIIAGPIVTGFVFLFMILGPIFYLTQYIGISFLSNLLEFFLNHIYILIEKILIIFSGFPFLYFDNIMGKYWGYVIIIISIFIFIYPVIFIIMRIKQEQ